MHLAVYSAIGIAFAFRSIKWVNEICILQTDCNLYDADGVLGYGYLGRFSLDTAMMYVSGWFMVPVLYNVVAPSLGLYMVLWFTIMTSYTLMLLLLFWIPVFVLHRRIIRSKCKIVERFGESAVLALQKLQSKYTDAGAAKFEFHRNVLADARSIREWPLRVDELVRFSLSVVILPVIVSFIVPL